MAGAEAQQAMQNNISTMQAAVKSLEPGNPEQQQATAQNLLTFMEVHLTLLEQYLAAAAAAAADSQGSVATAVAQMMQDKVPQQLAMVVAAVMKKADMLHTAVAMFCSFVPVLTQLKQAQEEHLKQQLRSDTYQQGKLLAEFSAALTAQLQKAGLLKLLPDLLLQWQLVSPCLSDCPMCAGADVLGASTPAATPAAAAAAAAAVPSAAAAHSDHTGGPAAAASSAADAPDNQPVYTCVPLTQAALLRACSQLLHCCPGCVTQEDPAVTDWVATAAQVALHSLQRISMHVREQREQELLQELSNAGGYCIQPPPRPAVLQLGLSSLDMLAALAFAPQKELSPGMAALTAFDAAEEGKQVMLSRPCILHGMAALTAAAVLGWELWHRLQNCSTICSSSSNGSNSKCRNDASCTAGSNPAPSAAAAAANQSLDAAAVRDQSSSSSSNSAVLPGSKGTGGAAAAARAGVRGQARQFGTLPSHTLEATWRLVCSIEDWAFGELLPQPFTMLLEGVGCCPKALLWLAGVWLQVEATDDLEAGVDRQQQQQQQQRAEQQQQQRGEQRAEQQQQQCGEQRAVQQQQQCGEQRAEQQQQPQQQCEVSIFHQAMSRVLLRACSAYSEVSDIQSPFYRTAAKKKQPPAAQEQQQQEVQMVQHLLMSMLLLRWVARWGLQGLFQPSGTEPELRRCVWQAVRAAWKCQELWLQQQKQTGAAAGSSRSSSRGQTAAAADYRRWCMKWAAGGKFSSAVLLEGLQVHVLLVQQCVQQLQKRVSCCSDRRCSISFSTLPPSEAFVLAVDPATSDAANATEQALQYAGYALSDLVSVATAAAAAAPAADVDVLLNCRPLLFELAGLLSTCFRCRGQCHKPGRFISGDKELLKVFQQLVLGTGSNSEQAGSAGQSRQQQQGPAAAAAVTEAGVRACGLLPYLATTAPAGGKEQQQLLDLLLSALKFYAAHSDSLYTRVYKVKYQTGWLAGACDAVRAACWASRLMLASWQPGPSAAAAAVSVANGSAAGLPQGRQQGQAAGQQPRGSSSSSGCAAAAAAGGFAALLPWLVLLGRALQLWVQLFKMYVQLPPTAVCGG